MLVPTGYIVYAIEISSSYNSIPGKHQQPQMKTGISVISELAKFHILNIQETKTHINKSVNFQLYVYEVFLEIHLHLTTTLSMNSIFGVK